MSVPAKLFQNGLRRRKRANLFVKIQVRKAPFSGNLQITPWLTIGSYIEFRRRIELIQDFGFPGSAGRIKIAGNGQQIGAVGMYPPQVRVYDVNDLSMKFKRHLDCEIREFLVRLIYF